MIDVISYEELRKVQNIERDNKELQHLEEDFFKKVREYIESKQKILNENKDKDNTFSRVSIEQIEKELCNIDNILIDLCSRRSKKIILQAITNINSRIHDTEKMLPFEERLYNETIKMLKENTSSFMSCFEDKPEIQESKPISTAKVIHFLEPTPSFLWNDGKTYGPYNSGDVASVPFQVGEILIKEKKAIELITK